MSRAAFRLAAALPAVMGLALAGCLADAPPPSATPTPSLAPDPTPTVTTYQLSTTAWYAGFVLAFHAATSTLDATGGAVAVELTIRNPGTEDATPDGPIVLAAGDRETEPRRDSVLPLVPAGGSAEATIVYDVDGRFDVPGSAVRIGRQTEHRAIVPLQAGNAAEVSLEPMVVPLSVTGQAGVLIVELEGLELRADLPDWNQELGPGLLALTLTYSATYRSDFVGGFAFTAANVALRLPDGTLVQPRRDGHSQSAAVIGPGSREAGLRSRFEVPVPGTGGYALVVTDGSVSKELPFAIEPP